MTFLQEKCLLFFVFMISGITVVISARHHHNPYTPPKLKCLSDLFPNTPFNDGFSQFFGGSNLQQKDNGSYVSLSLDKSTGSGFVSKNRYHYGFFSAAMKLPPGYTSGVVVAYYLSNADMFPRNHDEIDFELLGHQNRKDWILQTNIYGNGSVKYTGREEKIRLWFNPTKEFHTYTIIWNSHHMVFLVDNVPIREATFSEAMSSVYPSKPMLIYSTIWDGSEWATNGGKTPVNYKYAPFVASFKEMKMEGCIWDQTKQLCANNNNTMNYKYAPFVAPFKEMKMEGCIWDQTKQLCANNNNTMNYKYAPFVAPFKEMKMEGCIWDQTKQLCANNNNTTKDGSLDPVEGDDFVKLSDDQRKGMEGVRKSFLIYSYCNDSKRFSTLPAECKK